MKRLLTTCLLVISLMMMPSMAWAGADAPMPVAPQPPDAVSLGEYDQITKYHLAILFADIFDQMIGTQWREQANPGNYTGVACGKDIQLLPQQDQLDICDLRATPGTGFMQSHWESGYGYRFGMNDLIQQDDFAVQLYEAQKVLHWYNMRYQDNPNYGMLPSANGYGHMDDFDLTDPLPNHKAYWDMPNNSYGEVAATVMAKPWMRVIEIEEHVGQGGSNWGSPSFHPDDPQELGDTQLELQRWYCSNLGSVTGLSIDQSQLPDGCWDTLWIYNGTVGMDDTYFAYEGWPENPNIPGQGFCEC